MGRSLGRAAVDLPVEVAGGDSHRRLPQRDPRSQTWGQMRPHEQVCGFKPPGKTHRGRLC